MLEEEAALLSALLDDELEPRERLAAEGLLRVRSDAREWLAAVRALAEVGREIWEGLADAPARGELADAVAEPGLVVGNGRAAPRLNGWLSLFRRDPGDESSKT